MNENAMIIECPSGLRVGVTKLKVKQFKLLGNKKAIETGETFEQFLASCASNVIDPGPAYAASYTQGTVFDWKRALQGDRFAALLGIRRATHAASFDFDLRCAACGKEYGWSVDLKDMPIVKYPASSIDAFAAKRDLSVKVRGDDGVERELFFRLMTGAEEERIRNHLDRLEKSDKRSRKHPFDPLIDGGLARIVKISPAPSDAREWYEELDSDEFLKIGHALEATSGGVDTTLECVHSDDPRCGGVTKIELPFASKGFWIPKGPGMGSMESNAPTKLAHSLGGDRDGHEQD